MSKELVISSNRHETKVAILEDDQLVEIYFQRANEYSLAGSIHKGRVTRVLPGMQSAFVDLGLERDTFLYVSDFFDENGDEYDQIATTADEKAAHRLTTRSEPRTESRADFRGDASGPKPVAAAEVPPPAVEETPRETETRPPVVSPSVERRDEGEQRDPRGRRSRRRRTRGRGFPESKYASDVAAGPRAERAEFEPAEVFEPPADVILLPGESLAKYSNRPAGSEPTLQEDQEENETAAQSAASAFDSAAEAAALFGAELDSDDTVASAFPDPSFIAPHSLAHVPAPDLTEEATDDTASELTQAIDTTDTEA